MENDSPKEVEALCKECGHGFKSYMDRVLAAEQGPRNSKNIECPVWRVRRLQNRPIARMFTARCGIM